MGPARVPRRAEGDRPAALHPGLDGEADARRARPARRDPHGRGFEAVADPRGGGPPTGSDLNAEGEKQASILRAEGEAAAIQNVFDAIHAGRPDDKLLAYQYLQTLPKISEGTANKMWIIPSEFTEAMRGLGSAFTSGAGAVSTAPRATQAPPTPPSTDPGPAPTP